MRVLMTAWRRFLREAATSASAANTTTATTIQAQSGSPATFCCNVAAAAEDCAPAGAVANAVKTPEKAVVRSIIARVPVHGRAVTHDATSDGVEVLLGGRLS